MHRAKPFFYVCAGLFLLALSYHLGARSAGAQPGSTIIAAECDWPVAVACVDRTVYVLDVTNPQGLRVYPSVPGMDPVIAVNYNGPSNHITAMIANGNAYHTYLNGDGTWEVMGNVLGGPTPVQQESFGSLKVRYRGERGAAQPAPQGR